MADEGRTGNFLHQALERIIASEVDVIEWGRHIVHQHAAPEAPSARRMPQHRAENTPQNRGCERTLVRQAGAQESRYAIFDRFEQRVLTRISNQRCEARLSACGARREIAAE